MSRSFYWIIFIGLVFISFYVYSYQTDLDTEYSIQSTAYIENLTKACQATVDVNQLSTKEEMLYLYDTKQKRDTAINHFFSTLEQGFNIIGDSNTAETIRHRVPALCLIDTDGYYISYNLPHEDEEGGISLKFITSPIYTWSFVEENGNYAIRFYLSDYVEVTNLATGEIKKGTHKKVFQAFQKPVMLSFLNDINAFQEKKTEIIVEQIIQTVEYYINNYNITVNRLQNDVSVTDYALHYGFDLPHIQYQEWCNLIEEPASLAFLQGVPVMNTNRILNIYAMAGGELTKRIGYITDWGRDESGAATLYYHRYNCTLLDYPLDFGMDKTTAAKKGAFPCEICRP